VEIGHGFVFLAGSDNIYRAGYPAARTGLGTLLKEASIREAAKASYRGTLAVTDELGTSLIVSFRHLGHYDLFLGVALDRSDVLAAYQRNRTYYVAAGLVLSCLLLCLGALLIRNKNRTLRISRVMDDTLQAMTQGIIMVDENGSVPVINRRAIELLGLPGELAGNSPRYGELMDWLTNGEFEEHRRATDRNMPTVYDLRNGASSYERTQPNGTILEIRTVTLADQRAVCTFTDITERRRFEDRIAYLAHHDNLTGLPNRTMFADRLAHEINRHGEARFAVLFLDLDRFKLVNDTWGHGVGDQLLVMVATRLRESVRISDCVARFGGDEFAVLLAGPMSDEDADRLAHILIDKVSESYEIAGRKLSIGVSVGIAFYPDHGRYSEQLLKCADIALYAVKGNRGGEVQRFSPEMDLLLQQQIDLERDLRAAIDDDAIEVYFQPICDTSTGRPFCYESLARWTHPIRGNISPGVFISLAEESNLIVPLGLSILRMACRAAYRWPGEISLTVNVSPLQLLSGEFEGSVLTVLNETGLSPTRLGLEITEGVIIRNEESVAHVLKRLQHHGIRILLDDFGTGHAGLSYLVRFGFDCIKIDRSFVARMLEDKAAQAIIRATLALSEELQLDVVAEGVETRAQLAILRRLGCNKVQGYIYGRPQPDWFHAGPADQQDDGARKYCQPSRGKISGPN
jgi:diguanylate cyclase (GGDEF)-like protein